MSLTLVTPPAVEPVTLSEMKLQCGLGPMEDTDQLREQTLAEQLRPAIIAARQDCEAICARAFINQSWKLTLDRFPRWSDQYEFAHRLDIKLPMPSFQSLTTFTYIDSTGTTQDNKATGAWGYQIVSGGDSTMSRLRPPIGVGWPITQWELPDAVQIVFQSGFGGGPSALPYAIRNAVKINAQWLYEGAKGTQPEAVRMLLSPYIIDIT